ncbi:hypothetical protein ZIOFF_012595 [Zingiber officinale]|uniref:Uncharacterized protein n=1 Tax=Zingiber officinale TaxID=94328 RepID=A0A8J5I069_ZINOF|nr:hypothetical protein ZIOFF_012595 [Zingiber officinale]
MASSSQYRLVLLFLCLFPVARLCLAGRGTPEFADKKAAELVPGGSGRYSVGSRETPAMGGVSGDSGLGAAEFQFLPGNDDTFIPNPGFEIPNPFRPRIP